MTNNKEISQDNIIGNTMLSELYKFNLIPNTKNPACAWRNTKNHYKKHPRGNYGIPTGQVNDIIVLDLDFYKLDANELLANPFIQIYGETPTFDTFTVASPSGGLHYYFKFEENMQGNTQNKKLEIDTRSNGGFIVGPGSKTPSKVTGVVDDYKIINDISINKMPDDLREWMLENLYKKDKSKTASASKPHIQINNIESLYTYSFTDALLRRIFDTLPDGYWENYQGVDGEPSFLVWTTACKILKCSDLWNEYNIKKDKEAITQAVSYNKKPNPRYDYDKNINVWNGCNVNVDCVANLLRHCTLPNADKLIDYHKFQPTIRDEIQPDVTFTRGKLGYDFFDKDIPREPKRDFFTYLREMEDKLQETRNLPGNRSLSDEEFNAQVEVKLSKLKAQFIAEVPKLTEYKNVFVKSDTGTGKTTSFAHYIKRNKLKFLSIVSRKTLGEDQYHKFSEMGITCDYYEHVGIQHSSKSMICQIDSLAYKYPYGYDYYGFDWSDTVVYLDEYNSLIRHLIRSATMDDKRARVYELFVHILNNCKQVICTDADISDTSLMFMQLNKINKTFTYNRNIYRHNNQIPAEEIFNYDDLLDKLKKTNKWLCATDGKGNADILAKEFPDAVVITKDTLSLPDFEAHDRIIYSPKVTYGIDSTMEREVFVTLKILSTSISPPPLFSFHFPFLLTLANMSSIQMEEMIVKLRKENKKLREENEELDEDKLDLSQKIDILTKELEQCHTIISRHHEERKQNKKK